MKDKSGVAATVPVGAIGDGGSFKLVASQPAADFDTELQQNGLKRKSNFYKLEVNGEGDSLPDAVISFPSAAPGDRVAKLIEESGLIWADDEEVDGQRVVHAFIGLPGDKTPQYFLLGSVEGANAAPGDTMAKYANTTAASGAGSHHLADLMPEDEVWPPSVFEDCSIKFKNVRVGFSCRRDKTYHNEIYSFEIKDEWEKNLSKVDALLVKIKELRIKYFKMGFFGAKMYFSLPIHVLQGSSSPLYAPRLGQIYFGWNEIVETTPDPKIEQTIAHELFHWVEHKTYNMRIFSEMVGEMSWWVEMSAEAASFLINPSNEQVELKFYGAVSNGGAGSKLTYQEPPFDWYMIDEDSRYIQALQFFMMMSRKTAPGDITCLPDQAGFVDAINKGIDGIAEGNNKEIYRAGNWYFAQYLLNQPPENMCRDMETGGILETGVGYGDYVHASSYRPIGDKKGLTALTNNITKGDNGVATISATIAAGALYPLRVSNGANLPFPNPDNLEGWASPSVPYILKIKPSVPYFFKIGDDKVKWNDGKTELVISPITSVNPVTVYEPDASGNLVKAEKPGIPVVRIVAYNNTDTETVFEATFEPDTPMLVLDPTSLNDLTQKPDQVLTARLENVLPVVTEPVEFKFTQVFADGSTQEISSGQAAPKNGIAEMSYLQNFSDPTIKEVRVSAMYKLAGKEVTINGVIPVATITPFNRIGISNIKVVGSDVEVAYTIDNYSCPIRWIDQNNFEYNPALGDCVVMEDQKTNTVALKGQLIMNTIDIQFDSNSGDGTTTCREVFNLVGIPKMDSRQKSDIFSFDNFDNPNEGDVSAHMTGFLGYKVPNGMNMYGAFECSGLPANGNSLHVEISLN